MTPDEMRPEDQMMRIIAAKWISKPVYIAAELGIADLLANGPRPIDEIARETGTHAPTLYRLMRALASAGIFAEQEGRLFTLTPMAACLQSGALRAAAILFNAGWSDAAWSCLLHSVKTGKTAFEKAHGKPLIEWLGKHPEAGEVFNEANAQRAAADHPALLAAYDFASIGHLTDLGGGHAGPLAAILTAHPKMTALLADLPPVVAGAAKRLEGLGLTSRCAVVPCDFFEQVPPVKETCLLSNVLHDWPDGACRQILANVHAAMQPGARLLVVEMVLPPGNTPSVAKLLDLEMLVITGGRERTFAEFESLLTGAGFRDFRRFPAEGEMCVMEVKREQS